MGGKKPARPGTLNPMTIVTADQLQVLYDTGHQCVDLHGDGEPFMQRSKLFAIGGDYPGLGKALSKQVAGSTFGCVWCKIQGRTVPSASSMCYPDHRVLLPDDHPFRTSDEWAENCDEVVGGDLRRDPLATAAVAERLENEWLDTGEYSEEGGRQSQGVTGQCAFARIEYFNGPFDVMMAAGPDYAHVCKVVCGHIKDTLQGANTPARPQRPVTKVDEAWRLLQAVCTIQRDHLWEDDEAAGPETVGDVVDWLMDPDGTIAEDLEVPLNDSKSIQDDFVRGLMRVPVAELDLDNQDASAWRKARAELRKVLRAEVKVQRRLAVFDSETVPGFDELCERHAELTMTQQDIDRVTIAKARLIAPHTINDTTRRIFTGISGGAAVLAVDTSARMKMHCWQQFCKYTARYLFDMCDSVSDDTYNVIMRVFDCLGFLAQWEWTRSELDKLELMVIETICMFEVTFPRSTHVMMLHLMLELALNIKRNGPVGELWGYPLERWVSLLRMSESESERERERE
jgi:hypothetical protein